MSILHALAKRLPLCLIDLLYQFLLSDYQRAMRFVTVADPNIFHIIGAKKALQVFRHAEKNVPAYLSFCLQNNIDLQKIKTPDDFNRLVPITEKINYIKKYSLTDRCIGGKFPKYGSIDESGGTSGTPSNWIHAVQENEFLSSFITLEMEYAYQISNKNLVVISAWSVGPWATGIRFCQIMQNAAVVKSVGTSVEKIEETLCTFGTQCHYLIAGYPPFLKKFLDETKLNLKQYKIDILTGGEPISLEWKAYFESKIGKGASLFSSYGASDIDINIGFETRFSQIIREKCQKNKQLHQELFGVMPTVPMLFQYNPLVHYITQTYNRAEGKSEFVITLCDPTVVSPKVRYNLHDEGGVFTYQEMLQILARYEPKLVETYLKSYAKWPLLRLPFLYVAGRTDGTVSVDGANVYPDQIEAGILSSKELEKKTNAFLIYKAVVKKKNLKLTVAIQLKEKVAAGKLLQKKYHNAILNKLLEVNPDFQESFTYNKALCDPQIILHKYTSKLFAENEEGVKKKYIKQ